MAATAPTRTQVLSLYSSLIRTSRSFASYNFRNYFIRNTRDKFKAHLDETDPSRISELYAKGLEDLAVLKRAVVVNRLYEGPKLVVEKPRVIVGGGGSGMEAGGGGAGQSV